MKRLAYQPTVAELSFVSVVFVARLRNIPSRPNNDVHQLVAQQLVLLRYTVGTGSVAVYNLTPSPVHLKAVHNSQGWDVEG